MTNKVPIEVIKFPYRHPIYNPDGPIFEGNLYEKIILEQEYKKIVENSTNPPPAEIDAELEKEVATKIYNEFGQYIDLKNCNTPILRELIENYIGSKLVQVRMNKVLYTDGVMKLTIYTDKEGNLKEFYNKHPLLKDFNDLNNSSMTILAKINEIISGIKIEVTNKTASIQDLMFAIDGEVTEVEPTTNDDEPTPNPLLEYEVQEWRTIE